MPYENPPAEPIGENQLADQIEKNELEGKISTQKKMLSGVVQIGRIIEWAADDPEEPKDTVPPAVDLIC